MNKIYRRKLQNARAGQLESKDILNMKTDYWFQKFNFNNFSFIRKHCLMKFIDLTHWDVFSILEVKQ